MSLISIGKIEVNYLLYFLVFILIIISLNCISFYGLKDIHNYNVSLLVITMYSFSIIFIIPEIIINKSKLKHFFSREKKLNKLNIYLKIFLIEQTSKLLFLIF